YQRLGEAANRRSLSQGGAALVDGMPAHRSHVCTSVITRPLIVHGRPPSRNPATSRGRFSQRPRVLVRGGGSGGRPGSTSRRRDLAGPSRSEEPKRTRRRQD